MYNLELKALGFNYSLKEVIGKILTIFQGKACNLWIPVNTALELVLRETVVT